MKDVDGVQDVFCGTETVVYVKRGGPSVSPEAIEAVLESFDLAVDGVERDDSVIL